MIKKFKNFCDTPITWGTSFKLSGICALIYMTIALGFILYSKYQSKKFEESLQKQENEDL